MFSPFGRAGRCNYIQGSPPWEPRPLPLPLPRPRGLSVSISAALLTGAFRFVPAVVFSGSSWSLEGSSTGTDP